MRLRSVCRALLMLDVAYCVASLALPDLPAWKMFDAKASEPFTLLDGEGRPIDAYAWVPRGVPELDARDAVRIARWLCAEGHARPPLRVASVSLTKTIVAAECAPRDPHAAR